MKGKLKRTAKFLYALVFTILIVSCAKEEDVSQDQVVTNAEIWFSSVKESYDDPIFKYIKELQWQNAIVTTGEKGEIIEIPFTLKDNIAVTNDKQNQLKAYYRLVLIKDIGQVYVPFYLQIFTNDENYDNLDKKFNYYNIKDDFNGFINVYEPERQVSYTEKYEHGIRINPNATAKLDVMMCTYLGWWYEDGTFEEISLVGCNGGSGSLSYRPPAYGGGGGGTSNNSTNIIVPPSCQSFNYITKKGSIWQEASVKNINFKIVLLTENGFEIMHVIDYLQPTYFGVPTNLRIGDTDISPGIAATISARAISASIHEVVARYGNKYVSELTVSLYFQERVKDNFDLYLRGSRVNFNSTADLASTNYKSTMLYPDNCN